MINKESTEELQKKNSDEDDEENQEIETTTTLRLNFPTLGKMLLEILTDFVLTSKNCVTVQEICNKEASFAGFWFEAHFRAFCATSKQLSVACVNFLVTLQLGLPEFYL